MAPNAQEILPTRWSLLSRLKDWDDQDSWRQFFDTYWQLIYNSGVKAGLTDTEAEELVQEVVIGVAKKMGDFKADPAAGSFKSWLLTLTRWRIHDQLRKRPPPPPESRRLPQERTRTATIERLADTAPGPLDAEWDTEWEKHLLQAAFERVKKQVRPELIQIFDLVIHKQWPALKVARRLGVNLARVYYARCKVSALLKREIKRLEEHGI